MAHFVKTSVYPEGSHQMSLECFWLVVNVLLSTFIINDTENSDKINREICTALFPNPINPVQTDGSDRP